MKRSFFSFVASLFAATMFTSSAFAAPLVYSNFDTRLQGAFAPSATPTSIDGDGSLKMQTFDNSSQGKVSVIFYQAGGAQLGTLGSLSQLSVDFYKSSTPATGSTSQFAYRLNLGGGTSLVWENQYNGNNAVNTDSWNDNFNITNGNFWQAQNNGVTFVNFNNGGDAQTLSQWTNGQVPNSTGNGSGAPGTPMVLSANTPVYGLEIAYGSGVGAFTGYVDDVTLNFGANTFNGNVAVPEPASIGLMASVAGLLCGRRRRIEKA